MAAAAYTSSIYIADETFTERQRIFEDLFSSDRIFGERRNYKESIRQMLKNHERRLIVNINDLRMTNTEIANGIIREPLEWIPPMELALKESAKLLNDHTYDYDVEEVELHIGLEGSFGALHTTPRHLSANLLGHTVCLDGIITSCSLVRPKLLRSVHYSESKKAFLCREYWDATMLNANGTITNSSYPTSPEESLISEFGLCSYRDYQTVSMQEMPEKAPAGQLPRHVDVILDDDLVDSVKPGDRVQIVGVYKSLNSGSISTAGIPSHFRAVVIALRVKLVGADSQIPTLSSDDLHNIKAVSKRRDVFSLLSQSLAPSIWGHEWVKKAVLLMLLGGIEKNLPNGTHLRGDINLMMVGDPSTAKSQMLRFVLSLAPLAIATTGRGSSGVGLTAAVTSDKETGERRLEAGAMVLADRGIVCIDEFDKMSDMDRVAIHEVMEQQTVTIAKAGIHATLNARCSVLAAANPIWGQYKETASPQENIRLPDSLLSRFDLLFIILDTSTPEHDKRISSHVLKMHRHIPSGLLEGQPIDEERILAVDDSDAEDENGLDSLGRASNSLAVFQRHYAQNEGSNELVEGEEEEDNVEHEILTIPFLKKYIHYARSNIIPVLTRTATEEIVAAYANFRQKRDAVSGGDVASEAKTFPVTPRTLETLIRLSTAHAKSRLSSKIERRDARVAIELLEYCLYKEVKKKPSKRRKQAAVQESSEEDSNSEDDGEDNEVDEEDKGKEKIESYTPRRSTRSTSKVPPSPVAMETLSLEEQISASVLATSSAGATQSQSLHFIPTQESLPGTFVEPSFDSTENTQATTAASTSRTTSSQDIAKAVRSALHRLRSASRSAVFETSVPQLHEEMIKENVSFMGLDHSEILVVLEDMQNLNQVMISDGSIYVI